MIGVAPMVRILGGMPDLCQNEQKTTDTGGHPRALRTAIELGMRRLAPGLKLPSKQCVRVATAPDAERIGGYLGSHVEPLGSFDRCPGRCQWSDSRDLASRPERAS